MRLLKHKDNAAWWMAKEGHATAEQIARFAREYQRVEGHGMMGVVTVAEGAGWVSGYQIGSVVTCTCMEEAVAVWVSNGYSAQVVWRKSN